VGEGPILSIIETISGLTRKKALKEVFNQVTVPEIWELAAQSYDQLFSHYS